MDTITGSIPVLTTKNKFVSIKIITYICGMENKIYTFDDLVFNQHPNHGYQPGAVQAVLTLNNNVEVSVVGGGGGGLYGDGVETFEMAAFDSLGKFIKLGVNDDVIGWRSRTEITEIMVKLQQDLVVG